MNPCKRTERPTFAADTGARRHFGCGSGKRRLSKAAVAALCGLALIGCGQEAAQEPDAEAAAAAPPAAPVLESNPNKNAYFGDLHVHTRHSFDAFLFGTRATRMTPTPSLGAKRWRMQPGRK